MGLWLGNQRQVDFALAGRNHRTSGRWHQRGRGGGRGRSSYNRSGRRGRRCGDWKRCRGGGRGGCAGGLYNHHTGHPDTTSPAMRFAEVAERAGRIERMADRRPGTADIAGSALAKPEAAVIGSHVVKAAGALPYHGIPRRNRDRGWRKGAIGPHLHREGRCGVKGRRRRGYGCPSWLAEAAREDGGHGERHVMSARYVWVSAECTCGGHAGEQRY